MNKIIRKDHTYRITIEEQVTGGEQGRSVELEFSDREDLLNVIEKMKTGSGLETQTATRVGLALRLLGPVLMENRKHPLFVDFMPHFKQFMQNLKSHIKNNQ
ncbi:DUF3861 domain-containing protein [Vibrio hippocampi]|uniref:DUF3861 domain-containing protein n=1 Tax=Vibrio hippocampi TaxID=654686 RepID=A0ABN8DN30_9VIBR|nr:DUF3861 domain-containing protein [Vibrio hippocampi]CAH0529678.1 hypothetical protein VHP8226_03433 [Vibrio hippocampi]